MVHFWGHTQFYGGLCSVQPSSMFFYSYFFFFRQVRYILALVVYSGISECASTRMAQKFHRHRFIVQQLQRESTHVKKCTHADFCRNFWTPNQKIPVLFQTIHICHPRKICTAERRVISNTYVVSNMRYRSLVYFQCWILVHWLFDIWIRYQSNKSSVVLIKINHTAVLSWR